MKTLSKLLFSHTTMALLMIAIGISMGMATFYENDYGTITAKAIFYNAKWFELLWLLLTINMLGSTFKNKMYKKEKLAVLLFHLAFVIMMIGAVITRYTSFEGNMSIREGDIQDKILTSSNYFDVKTISENDTIESSDLILLSDWVYPSYDKNISIKKHTVNIKINNFVASAVETLINDPKGTNCIELVVGDSINGISTYFLSSGNQIIHGNKTIGLESKKQSDLPFSINNDELQLNMSIPVKAFNAMAGTVDTIAADSLFILKTDVIYSVNNVEFIIKKHIKKGSAQLIKVEDHQSLNAQDALACEITIDGQSQKVVVYGEDNVLGKGLVTTINGVKVILTYGPKQIKLPFALKLNDFILERYPGSESPSSFKSEVQLIDSENKIDEKHSIFMNNILKHRGYRFFQSSYDQDEQGTVLSVNYDATGTFITYLGYLLMTIGIVLSFFAKKSRFRELIRNSSSKIAIISFLLLSSFISKNTLAQDASTAAPVQVHFDKKYADEFGKLCIVDMKGRTKPINTVAFEVVRKITKQSSINGYSPCEIILGMSFNPEYWKTVPMIKVSHDKIKKLLKKDADFVAFNDIQLKSTGEYLLKNEVEKANAMPAKKRSKYEKELLKVDERVNICIPIFSGSMLTIFPANNGSHWVSLGDVLGMELTAESQVILDLTSKQSTAMLHAIESGSWDDAYKNLEEIKAYQLKNSGGHLPSQSKINLEINYNKLNIFSHLLKTYALIGIVLLVLVFVNIFKASFKLNNVLKIAFTLTLILFVLHTIGLIVRWYLSGHAPISNGYETLLFISWTTILGGLILSKQSPLTLAASLILASLSLAVSSMTMMDPELTNLVPVLKSYWLVIHVTIITSSYGFFAIAAIAGLINIIVASLQTKSNLQLLRPTIKELSRIIEIAVIVGLYLLTIGTFLGGVWANESWGRYWGWDPKETWALVSIVVYSIVFHMRKIPGLKGNIQISIAALLAFSSILMTYFGVNYFLSGMHSYAAGDDMVIPNYIYYIVALAMVLIATSIIGELRVNKLIAKEEE